MFKVHVQIKYKVIINNLVHALRKNWSVRLTSRRMHFGWYCLHLCLLYDRLQVETGFPLLKSVSRPSDSSCGDKPEINWYGLRVPWVKVVTG